MQSPFYLSFRDFENNYYYHLEQWFEEFHNTNEIDFLRHLAAIYKPYLSYNSTENKLQTEATIKVKNCFFPAIENFGISFNIDEKKANSSGNIHQVSEWKTITMMEYAQCILDKINKHFYQNNITMKENESVLSYINHYEIIMARENTGYCLDYDLHQKALPFLRAFLPHFGSTVDISLYRNFYFSMVRIADFIDKKLKSVEAFEYSIYNDLRTDFAMKRHFKKQSFLTLCN